MSVLEDEIDHNFGVFRSDWTGQTQKNWTELQKHKHYVESYRRLSALQAIKTDLVAPSFSPESAAFFFEAHNDALVSHVSGSLGAWRSALQALRSCLENTLAAIYYKDHPIELKLWAAGQFRLSFAALHNYALKHPAFIGINPTLTGLDVIQEEYATLS
jgi:hypothetical protein